LGLCDAKILEGRYPVRAVIETRLLQPVTPADLVTVTRLHDDAEAIDGHASLGEAVWRDLDQPLEPVSAGVLATHDDRAVGFAYVYRSDSFSPPHWAAGLVVHPDARGDSDVEFALLERVAEHVGNEGGGLVVLWILEPGGHDDIATARAGFRHQRDLLQQRVTLPLGESPGWPPGVEVRAFVPGQDDADWLAVNNRAFAGHAEQGGWVQATLERRMAEPWFDPKGFLLAFDPDGLAGYCWTKVHPATDADPELGEIFVIGVDPSRQGSGLGWALVVGGLASLAERGVRTGMLFVDGNNEAALRLYEALGFTTHRLDRAYEREVVPAPAVP
jgi:mycothiol synthase